MKTNENIKPILKWVGGKRQLLAEIEQRLPDKIDYYVEPFVGGGAVLFDIQPRHARINDYNKELINVYRTIGDNPDELIKELVIHEENNERFGSEWFYYVRGLDRQSDFNELSNVEKAARTIYINKTCFNGLFRVNSTGQFNVSYGRYKRPNIVNEAVIRALHNYFNDADIDIRRGDFTECLKDLPTGTFIYLDPPYMPITVTSSFTAYTDKGFGFDEQTRLRNECIKLREQGIHFLQSNSDCEEIRELYRDFTVEIVRARRSINSRGNKRGAVNEVLISG